MHKNKGLYISKNSTFGLALVYNSNKTGTYMLVPLTFQSN